MISLMAQGFVYRMRQLQQKCCCLSPKALCSSIIYYFLNRRALRRKSARCVFGGQTENVPVTSTKIQTTYVRAGHKNIHVVLPAAADRQTHENVFLVLCIFLNMVDLYEVSKIKVFVLQV